jgi:hypothetical protein
MASVPALILGAFFVIVGFLMLFVSVVMGFAVILIGLVPIGAGLLWPSSPSHDRLGREGHSICPRCGQANGADDLFCTRCGFYLALPA